MMDHDVVVRERMTERYLLDELDPAARDAFEEHYFDCAECALDVRAASEFVEQAKAVLVEKEPGVAPVPMPRPVPAPAGPKWLAWLRPAFAAPALAALLAVVGYQNLVAWPQLAKSLSSPRVLPWTSVNLDTFSGEGNRIRARKGSGFILYLRMPPEHRYDSYQAEFYGPSGTMEWSLAIPSSDAQDQVTIQVPPGSRAPGTYTVQLHANSSSGERKVVGRASFELQIEQ